MDKKLKKEDFKEALKELSLKELEELLKEVKALQKEVKERLEDK